MRKQFLSTIGMLCVLFMLSVSSRSQTTTATLSGAVSDESGGALSGAQITISNVATGVKRNAVADERGRFVVAQLSPGPYEITVTAAGFETLVRAGITLTVGQEATLSLPMKIGAVSEQVTVMGEAPIVNTASSSVSGIVEEKRIVDLPLNGRDFTQLALLQPGVVSVRNTDQLSTKGFGTRVSAAGSRADQTAWLLDGTNIKSMSNFGTPGGASGLLLGVDAVREFQVLTSNYSSEFGGNSGGVVNMVTKSGTNELHGTAYEFLRNDNLDARNFFDIPTKPGFERNQFGFSLGGPVKKNKLFFFGNYEGLRQILGVTRLAQVPDANAHRGLIPDGQGGLRQVQVASSIRPYLDTYPLPNADPLLDSRGNPSGLGNLFIPGTDRIGQNYFMGRGDYNPSESGTIFMRFAYDRAKDRNPDFLPVDTNEVQTRTGFYTIQYQRILSPKALSTSRVAFNRSAITSNVTLDENFPPATFPFDKTTPASVVFTGATGLGPNSRSIFVNNQNLWQASQSFIYTLGNHSLKFGGNAEMYWFFNNGGAGHTGAFAWGSLSSFLTDGPLLTFSVGVPGSSTDRTFRQEVIGVYVQDDWKWRPNFTWNLGLRYEPFTTPREKWGRVAVVKDYLNATAFSVGVPYWQNPSMKNYSPRVGFAWDPWGDGKTAVRAGYGIFFVDILNFYYRSASQKNPPFAGNVEDPQGNMVETIDAVQRLGPGILTPLMTPITQMEVIQYDLKPSYEMKFNFTVQRELPGKLSVLVGYLGGRGIHLWRSSKANSTFSTFVNGREFVAAGTPRPNPNVGTGDARLSDAQSFYDGLQLHVSKQFGRGFQFQTSYTWSKTIDDSTTSTANTDYREGSTSRPYNTKVDRGLSALHQAHNLVLNGIWAIPFPAGNGTISSIFGGWNFSGIFSASTGVPFSVKTSGSRAPDLGGSGLQRPDFVSGHSGSLINKGNVDQYYDVSAYALPPVGFYGNLGRNTLIGPGFASVDIGLRKDFAMAKFEGKRLEFRADAFNLLNRANFAPPANTVLNGANGSLVAGAGKITRTVSTSRQMQFGLKLVF